MTTTAKKVGPVLRGLDDRIVDAVIEAVQADNPNAEVEVDDRGGYVRVTCDRECRLTRASLEDALDEEFTLAQLEPALSGFAGRMRYVSDDEIVWFLERED
ncbi:MmoB/DmpM family protein [Pseudonocardia benzenivorans]|uniref:Monooxygenase component MmoB/DmpM n=2 Tax=Pseudonocardia TaxID=1847 RepID=F4CK62_PSEUX|nr:MmoB/DmpM family protein [Pseudonocardia dioxanivorans]AEA28168.1 monooxygenase component MmoB/DmpM [Pseudonocardia dioxanivorans CB1190]